MGIFKNITKTLKKAAPLIGSAIGMYYGGSFGAALGSGIGSLAGGRSVEDALKNAALTGATSYALGGKDFGRKFDFEKYGTSGSPLRTMFQGADTSVSSEGIKKAGGESFLSKLIPESTMGKVALAGGIGALASGVEDEPMMGGFQERPYPKGQMRAGMGMVDGISFNLNDDEERAEYFRRVREKQGFKDKEDEDEDVSINKRLGGMADFERLNNIQLGLVRDREDFTEQEKRMAEGILATRPQPLPLTSFGDVPDGMMNGGEVTGPGTGTSDSVPARLSDGEFVLTAKAVRGAGGGDRNVGAARMYDMMSQLERVA